MSKAISNKKFIAVIAVITLVAILGVCLVACNADSVGNKLKNKDYRVVTLTENTGSDGKLIYNAAKRISDFKEGVWATKGKNYVAVIWYETLDAAKEAEESFKTMTLLTPAVHRYEKIVYAGTEQGVKDAR
ncbi:MAG: hypothetical protein NC037_01600 [Bacteroides sp.]|nr:hypothetical protein [Bacillota bacterium]MCM1455209.1 hypothetical protein [Bacteroides sp.]